MSRRGLLLTMSLAAFVLLTACGAAVQNGEDGPLTASGTISAPSYRAASELNGRVLETFFAEGDMVEEGDVLFRLDGEILDAQLAQAGAAAAAAEVSVESAHAQLEAAEIQLAQAEQGARLQDPNTRSQTWADAPLNAYDLPIWYFDRTEEMEAAEQQVQAAEEALGVAEADLQQVLEDASNDDFVSVEKRLVEARTRFSLAQITRDQALLAQDRDELEDAAEKEFNAAEADLESVQLEYERLLSTDAAEEVLEARAHAAVSQARLENAQLLLDSFFSGEESLQVQSARAAVLQAETAADLAEANLEQALAALEVLQVQQSRLEVASPVDGIITARNLESGEIAPAGATVYVIGQLDEVTLTVYIPEDEYGQIRIGQEVEARVDSFPGQVYAGTVDRIADEAEFTPRNVQTLEGRLTTVYAIDITLPNASQELKPGMPADVTFLD